MSLPVTFPARGSIKSSGEGKLIFLPDNTNYELHLKTSVADASSDQPIAGTVQVTARKIWTVPSGGSFIAPIFGEPRTIQGRVKWLDESTLILQAGLNVIVKLPGAAAAIDLAHGPIEIGALVNVTAMPGATFARA